MKHLTILLTLAALAGAASTDSTAFARFRADSARAVQIWHVGDSLALSLHTRAQTVMDEAIYHLSRDTARKAK